MSNHDDDTPDADAVRATKRGWTMVAVMVATIFGAAYLLEA